MPATPCREADAHVAMTRRLAHFDVMADTRPRPDCLRHRGVRPIMKRSLFAELKRRNVIRMAGLYLVGAWLVTQVSSTVLPMFDAPAWLPRSVVILLAVGFIPVLVFSWVFELTPEGIKRDAEVK